jgi:hypothetical protein
LDFRSIVFLRQVGAEGAEHDRRQRALGRAPDAGVVAIGRRLGGVGRGEGIQLGVQAAGETLLLFEGDGLVERLEVDVEPAGTRIPDEVAVVTPWPEHAEHSSLRFSLSQHHALLCDAAPFGTLRLCSIPIRTNNNLTRGACQAERADSDSFRLAQDHAIANLNDNYNLCFAGCEGNWAAEVEILLAPEALLLVERGA